MRDRPAESELPVLWCDGGSRGNPGPAARRLDAACSASAPSVTRSFPRSISPHGRNAEPVVARQFEQWQ